MHPPVGSKKKLQNIGLKHEVLVKFLMRIFSSFDVLSKKLKRGSGTLKCKPPSLGSPVPNTTDSHKVPCMIFEPLCNSIETIAKCTDLLAAWCYTSVFGLKSQFSY